MSLNGWISVDDRLPDATSDEEYLVVVDGDVTSLWYFPNQGSWESDTGRMDQSRNSERVSHWQPMPEPPIK